MDIREPQISEYDAIIDLWQKTNLTRPWNNPRADIERAMDCATSTVFVAAHGAQIIGSVMTGYEGHRGWIYYLAVAPHHQKQGIGKELVMTAENWLKNQGCPKIMLMIRKENTDIK